MKILRNNFCIRNFGVKNYGQFQIFPSQVSKLRSSLRWLKTSNCHTSPFSTEVLNAKVLNAEVPTLTVWTFKDLYDFQKNLSKVEIFKVCYAKIKICFLRLKTILFLNFRKLSNKPLYGLYF